MTIGNVILELRKERNISQKKLADALNIGQSTVAQIELGRNEATASTIRKLSAFFEVSADYLLGLEDDFGARTAAPLPSASVPMGDNLSAEEHKVLEQYRSLPEQLRKLIRQQLDVFSSPEELLPKTDKKV